MALGELERVEQAAVAGLETDPFTIEVIKSNLVAIGDEMFIAMGRTSMSPIIYEVLDYAVGITDADGNVISQGNGVTLFIGVLTHAVRSVLDKFGKDGLQTGDILAVNDPFTGGGTHLSDVCMVMPVFYQGELLAFAANKAHWTEVGGMAPGSWTTDSTEIYQEGLQFPCIKVFNAGVEDTAITDLIRANVRTPEMSLGDFYAQCASLRLASNRIADVCARYGVRGFHDSLVSMFAHGRATARQALKDLPKGTYTARLNIDDDGFGGDSLPVQVKVTITDEEFICDFTGSSPQARGPINCSWTGLTTGVRCLWLAISEPRYLVNEGIFDPVRVICPPGTVFTASKPAPTSCYWESLLYVTDLVWSALAPHMPHRLSAGHFNTVGAEITTTFHPDTDEFTIIVEPNAGGWGARADGDGANGLFCVGDGETYNLPVEIMEQKFGFEMTRLSLNDEDPGGEGKFRGGRGVIREFKVLHDKGGTFTITLGRFKEPPWGVDGGLPGGRNYFVVTRADGREEDPTSKAARLPLQKGDIVSIRCGAGGGWGDPGERDRDMVLADVRAGLMPADTARTVYGVEIA
jgi:N-methylhydantoinase B